MNKLAILFGYLLPFVLLFVSPVNAQSTPSVTNAVVLAASHAGHPDRTVMVDGNPAIIVGGRPQLLITSFPGAPLLWRSSGHALTDILSRLTTVECDEDQIGWRVDGRTVLCTESPRQGLTVAQQAIAELQRMRLRTETQREMTSPIAAALAPRAIALVETILYARRHHGRAPRSARAKRAHRHHH